MSAAEWVEQSRLHLKDGGVPQSSARYLRSRQYAQHWPEDSARIRALDDLPRALDALDGVLVLHVGGWGCGNPSHTNPDVGCPDCFLGCDACGEAYPCPTISAIDSALKAKP